MYTASRLIAAATLSLSIAGVAQTAYTSPDGQFTIQVPSGWRAEPVADQPHLVEFRSGALSVTVLVNQQNANNAMTAKEAIDTDQNEFKGQCPTDRVRQLAPTTLLGFPAITAVATCRDPKSPAVVEDVATLTADHMLVVVTAISPLARYYANLPLLDGMRESLRLTGHPYLPTKPAESEDLTALRKACLVGVFTADECATQHHVPAWKPGEAAGKPLGGTYRDASGRFTVDYPAGWEAIAEGDNGVRGVQLRSGSSWINLMPAPAATDPSEVVLRQEREMVAGAKNGRTPPFGAVGLVQLFDRHLEIAYDDFESSSPEGDPIDTYVMGVGDLSGANPELLLVIASLSKKDRQAAAIPILGIAQSIHLMQVSSPVP